MLRPSEYEQEYRQIHWSLENHEWEQANKQTLKIVNKLVINEQKIPCHELKILEQWWKKYSNGRFGFSVQIKILEEIKEQQQQDQTTYDDNYIDLGSVNELIVKSVQKFVEQVGWYDRVNNGYLSWEDLKFKLEDAPIGHLPSYYLIHMDSKISGETTMPFGEFCFGILDKIRKCDPNYYLGLAE